MTDTPKNSPGPTSSRAVKRRSPKKKKKRGVEGYTYSRLVDEIAKKMQRMVRLKAADEFGMVTCVPSGTRVHWKEAQGGHFISRKHQRTKILEENIHPQTAHENLWLMKDSLHILNYRRWMVDFYGQDYVEYLEAEARKPLDTPRADLIVMYWEIVNRNKELEKKLEGIQATDEQDY